MPLIPIFAASRRYHRLPGGALLAEDTTFSFRRIERRRFVPASDRTAEVRIAAGDVPAFEVAAPRGSRLRFTAKPGRDDVLILPAADGVASVELTAREAHGAALRGELGLRLILAREPVAGGGAG